MTNKFDAAVNKILSEDWTDYIPNFLAKPEYTHGWKGRAKAAGDAVSLASWAIPGTGAIKGGAAAYKAAKMAKQGDSLKKKLQAARGISKTGTDAGATIMRNPGKTALGAAGVSLATGMDIKGGPADTAIIAAWDKLMGDGVPPDEAEAIIKKQIEDGTFIPPEVPQEKPLPSNIKNYWNSLTPAQKTAISGIGGAATGYALYKAFLDKDNKKKGKKNK